MTGHTARYDGCDVAHGGRRHVPGARGPRRLSSRRRWRARATRSWSRRARRSRRRRCSRPPSRERLAAGVGAEIVRRADALFERMTVVPEARVAARFGLRRARGDLDARRDRGRRPRRAARGRRWRANVGMRVDLEAIPVPPEVRAVCDHVGIDPYVAISEGTLIATVVAERADGFLAALRGCGHRRGGRGRDHRAGSGPPDRVAASGPRRSTHPGPRPLLGRVRGLGRGRVTSRGVDLLCVGDVMLDVHVDAGGAGTGRRRPRPRARPAGRDLGERGRLGRVGRRRGPACTAAWGATWRAAAGGGAARSRREDAPHAVRGRAHRHDAGGARDGGALDGGRPGRERALSRGPAPGMLVCGAVLVSGYLLLHEDTHAIAVAALERAVTPFVAVEAASWPLVEAFGVGPVLRGDGPGHGAPGERAARRASLAGRRRRGAARALGRAVPGGVREARAQRGPSRWRRRAVTGCPREPIDAS